MKRQLMLLALMGVMFNACASDEKTEVDGSAGDSSVKHDGSLPDQARGQAGLSFVVKYGSERLPFAAAWKPFIPGYGGRGPIVVMLCKSDDATCQSPVTLREVSAAETDGEPIQKSFGPQVSLSDLPAGSYKLMVFEDSEDSRERGFGWQDSFTTEEKEWGGVISESDLMLSDPDDTPELGHNPPPLPVDVELIDGQVKELGDVILGHYHQRNISPKATTEAGLIAVATEGGVRVVDLGSFTVKTAYENSGTSYYDYVMQDADGNLLNGKVCGIVKASNNAIFVLMLDSSAQNAGFAVKFDPVAGTQLSTHRVLFPGGNVDVPCRGYYHQQGGEEYLWVTNAMVADKAKNRLWYANVSDFSAASADITAGVADNTVDPVFDAGIDQIAASGETLYLAASANAAPCGGMSCVFKASFDAQGKPTLSKNGADYDALVGPGLKASVSSAQGDIDCMLETSPAAFAGMAIAPFHDGRELLFLGQCLEITIFDLSTGQRLDYNGAGPGKPGFNASLFGQGFTSFSLAPDGKILWAVSRQKSVFHFNFEKGPGGPRQTFNRHMFLPLDLTQGSEPGIHPDYNKEDIDDYEGTALSHETPKIDPGVDLDVAYLQKYLVNWAPSLAGHTPTTIPIGPSMVATNHTLWLRGSGIPGVSGLDNQGNVAVFALPEGKAVLWPRKDQTFYEVWMGGANTRWGFDLTPENDDPVATYGLIFFPSN